MWHSGGIVRHSTGTHSTGTHSMAGPGVGADSEVGCLRSVIMHRPGAELRRITPRTQHLLRWAGPPRALPWVDRAQQEHDQFADTLRTLGTEVIYLTGLLQDVLEYQTARDKAIGSALASSALGDELARILRHHLADLSPEDLAAALIAGLTPAEVRTGHGLVYDLLDPHDFVIDPLPSLVFSADAGAWIGDQAVVAALPGSRRREGDLFAVIYEHHPRFAGLRPPYQPGTTGLDGGDLLLLGPGVIAVGVGVHTTPASAELLARHLLRSGAARAVLAVPINQRAGDGCTSAAGRTHLDAMCTVLAEGVVLMAPSLAFTLTALAITARPGNAAGTGQDRGEHSGELRVSRPRPFLEAAARALEIDQLRLIDTGVVAATRPMAHWDDGGNALAAGGRTLVCDERNLETNARLAAAGFDVITVPCGELGGIRGGPRCMCAPLSRDPVPVPEPDADQSGRPAQDRDAGTRWADLAERDQSRKAPHAGPDLKPASDDALPPGELAPVR